VSGDLRLRLAGGRVTVESMSGDVTIDAAGAIGLKARAVSGDLRLRAPVVDALELSTTSGDVRIDAELGGGFDHSISSVSGDVHLATSSPVRVESQSIAGDIRADGMHRSEGGRGRRTVVVGNGSVRVGVRTTSGDVRVQQREPGEHPHVPVAPEPPVPPVAPEPPVPPMPAALASGAAGTDERTAGDRAADATDPAWVVAEAEAAPNLVRPDEPPAAWSAADSGVDRREAARLDILRALERGELDIEAASYRLSQLDEAGPRSFRGFC
jgi:hypothetical protein